MTSVFENYLHY